MIRIAAISTAIVTCLFATPTSTKAQMYGFTTKGLSIGANGSVTGLNGSERTSFGGGGAFVVGYGFSNNFSVHSGTSSSWVMPSGGDDFVLSHVALEGRYRIGSGRFTPHVSLGVSSSTASFGDSPWSSSGDKLTKRTMVGVATGAGVSYFVAPATTLDWSVRHTSGNVRCPDNSAADSACPTSTRVSAGFTWYPSNRSREQRTAAY
jgi:hypothetical protein